ncbi:MAG: cyanophycin synthetase, partial [Candidatus Portnoybacteria bacterium]|nr:cyanophycin synthetase [Candidatus Portnoybacteria bacterium]
AVSAARLFDIPTESIRKVLAEFTGLEGRIQLIKEIKGVKYINDTTATIPEATIAAMNSIASQYDLKPGALILIAGGADKNLEFGELAKIIAKQIKILLLLKGAATEKLETQIKKEASDQKIQLKILKFDDMKKAVATAAKLAKSGDIVLLSPGCASFGLFRHEFERGEKFNQAVNEL